MALENMGYKRSVINGDPEILYNSEYVGRAVTLDSGAFTDGVCKAGTPIGAAGAIASVTGGTKGVWTVQITTAFAADESIVIDGETYVCAAAEDVAAKKFAGANAAAQVTSLVKMIADGGFVVTAASDKLTFTQKVADASGSAPVVTTTATTGAVGSATQTTPPVAPTDTDVEGILLHDVYQHRPQGTIVIGGYINVERAEAHSGITYDSVTKAALKNVVFVAFPA